MLSWLVVTLALCLGQEPSRAAEERAPLERFEVPARQRGLKLLLLHRAPAARAAHAAPKQAVLLLHGNFFPASSSFSVELPGGSVVDRLADAGLSTYTLDLRGYGGSTRPPFMSEAIGPYVPLATTAQALEDIASALEFIRKRERLTRVSLVGWSWGAALVGGFAARSPERVDKLVLYAPGWLSSDPPPRPPPAGSYRTLDREASRARVLNGVPNDRIEEIHPSAWFQRWWEENLRYDPEGAGRTPPVVRAPSGVTQDGPDFWLRGKAPWDPERVRAPTLVIVGEWDRNTPPDMAKSVYDKLHKAASRELTILPEATHFALLEKNREALLVALTNFLLKSR